MAAQHTPGPWTARFKETKAYSGLPQSGTCSIENERHTRIVAHVVTAEPEDEANAHLIAAAPDMLQALREILADAYYVENPGGTLICAHCQELEGDPHNQDCSMQFVIDAITKAEGKS